MTTFVLATTNPHKVAEMEAFFRGYDVELLVRPTNVAEVEETSDTLEGNAGLKATALCAATGEAAMADDTGLFVDALGGRPGVRSARYAGVGARAEDNIEKLLRELAFVADDERGAHFRTVIAVSWPNGDFLTVEGVLEGAVAPSPRGGEGFGYDPVFVPRESPGRTLAELSLAEKNALSHRGRALRALALKLRGE